MSSATLRNRCDLLEIYASTDLSSPGFAVDDDIPEPTGARVAWNDLLPAWQQGTIAQGRDRRMNRLPRAFWVPRTGTSYLVVCTPVRLLLQKPAQIEHFDATISFPRLIAQIRSSLSLQVKQLADALSVERPTIYAWIKEQSEPRPQKRSRLRELYQLAREWDQLASEPLGKSLTDVASDGYSVLDFLLQSELPHALIKERLRAIARSRAQSRARGVTIKKGISQIAYEHGIDMTRVSQQNDQVDVITGKRIALD